MQNNPKKKRKKLGENLRVFIFKKKYKHYLHNHFFFFTIICYIIISQIKVQKIAAKTFHDYI